MFSIKPIPAFDDNYIWCIVKDNQAVVVDPGCAKSVSDYLAQHQLNLTAILITHHHRDHTGGIAQLLSTFDCPVFAGSESQVRNITHQLKEGESVSLFEGALELKVMDIPGHTLDHIAYYNDELVFCGDTLFSAGCGRLFEGTPAQMLSSLKKLAALGDDITVYPTHEYTSANIAFALAVEPKNEALQQYQAQVSELREKNIPSLPTSIKLEKSINPFLRASVAEITDRLIEQGKLDSDSKMLAAQDKELATFTAIRQWKDNF